VIIARVTGRDTYEVINNSNCKPPPLAVRLEKGSAASSVAVAGEEVLRESPASQATPKPKRNAWSATWHMLPW